MFFLQTAPDIYDKIEALQSRKTGSDLEWELAQRAVLALVIAAALYVLYRLLTGRRPPPQEAAAHDDDEAEPRVDLGSWADDDGEPLALTGLETGQHVALAWSLADLECQAGGEIVTVSDGGLTARFESEATPDGGEAVLMVEDEAGHVSFFEVDVDAAEAAADRRLSGPAAPCGRLHRDHVAQTRAIAAALVAGEPPASGDDEALPLRVSGVGLRELELLSDEAWKEGDRLLVRIQFVEHVDPISAQIEVASMRRGLAGMWRVAGRVVESSADFRAAVAHHVYATTIKPREPELAGKGPE